MAITYRGSATAQNAMSVSTSPQAWVVSLPSGTVSTDVILLCVEFDGGSEVTIVPPLGWTSVLRVNDGTGVTGWGLSYYVALGTVSTSELGFTTFPNPTAAMVSRHGYHALGYIGVDLTTPIDNAAVGQVNTDFTSVVTAPSITTLTSGALTLGTFGTWGFVDATFTHGSDFSGPLWGTQRALGSRSFSGDPVSRFSFEDKTQTSPGASGAATSDSQISNPGWHSIGIMIALRVFGAIPAPVQVLTNPGGAPNLLTFNGNLSSVWTNAHPKDPLIVQVRSH